MKKSDKQIPSGMSIAFQQVSVTGQGILPQAYFPPALQNTPMYVFGESILRK
ncbi:hypothetical cytosolic protein [Syntrophus aciditrophicus SB]|jgi:hypothetical protein|uniref:Hypothetical cytosolic protein n=1 Tax=Syntrophus aciditrophicus (strain SB) TaxID=56780 RepID=Q2LSK1_SYNAS|nr:hypothetical cytosolic protein [Syntrophus aciditrophicus SB]